MQNINLAFLDTFLDCTERQWNGGLYEVKFALHLSDDNSIQDVEKYLDECYGERSKREPAIYKDRHHCEIKISYDAAYHEEGREITSSLLKSWFRARRLELDATDARPANLLGLEKPIRQVEGLVLGFSNGTDIA